MKYLSLLLSFLAALFAYDWQLSHNGYMDAEYPLERWIDNVEKRVIR